MSLSRALAALAASSLVSCVGLSPDEHDGSAPFISGLAYDPQTVAVGTQSRVDGTLQFEDEDADVARLGIALLAEGMGEPEANEVPVSGSPLTEGQVPFMLLLQPPAAGAIELEVWLVDEAGHTSNVLSGTIVAE